jgi:hypothetical protein
MRSFPPHRPRPCELTEPRRSRPAAGSSGSRGRTPGRRQDGGGSRLSARAKRCLSTAARPSRVAPPGRETRSQAPSVHLMWIAPRYKRSCSNNSMIPKSGYRFSEKIMLQQIGPGWGRCAPVHIFPSPAGVMLHGYPRQLGTKLLINRKGIPMPWLMKQIREQPVYCQASSRPSSRF